MREGFHELVKVDIQFGEDDRTHTKIKNWRYENKEVKVPDGDRSMPEDIKADDPIMTDAMRLTVYGYIAAIRQGYYVTDVSVTVHVEDRDSTKAALYCDVSYQRRWTAWERMKNWWNRFLEGRKVKVTP